MTTYARLTQDKLALESIVELTPQQYASLAPWKQSFLRLYVVDAPPVPSAAQRVADGVPVIDATTYRKTWTLANKTAAELSADSQATELTQLKLAITALQADVTAGITAAPTTAAQAFVEIQDLKRRTLRAERVLLWLLRQQ